MRNRVILEPQRRPKQQVLPHRDNISRYGGSVTIRKKYSKEFKLDAISLVVEQQYTRAEAARSLEINPNLITRWLKENEQDNNGQVFRGNGKLTPEQEEIRQLKAKVRQLEMDKNILKEATVFFAKEIK
jgi:transposase